MANKKIERRAGKYGYCNLWALKTCAEIRAIYKRACDLKDFEAMKHVPMFIKNRMAYDRAAAELKKEK